MRAQPRRVGLEPGRDEQNRITLQLDDLRRQRVTYVERFRALLRSQAKILEASVETLDPESTPAAAPPPPPPAGQEIPVNEVGEALFSRQEQAGGSGHGG